MPQPPVCAFDKVKVTVYTPAVLRFGELSSPLVLLICKPDNGDIE